MYWLFTTMSIYFSTSTVIYGSKLDLSGTRMIGGGCRVFITVDVIAALDL